MYCIFGESVAFCGAYLVFVGVLNMAQFYMAQFHYKHLTTHQHRIQRIILPHSPPLTSSGRKDLIPCAV